MIGWLLCTFPEQIASPRVIKNVTWAVYILVLPTTLSILFGKYTLNYLKGDSAGNRTLYAGIFDLFVLFKVILHLSLQLLRGFLVYKCMVLYIIYASRVFTYEQLSNHVLKKQPTGVSQSLQTFDEIYRLYNSSLLSLYEICLIAVTYYPQLGALSLILF